MPNDAADILLAAARELRLRRFMGPLPFDVDQWMRNGLECDLPRLADGESLYHFEVRNIAYIGTYFKLYVGDQGEPRLMVGAPGTDNTFPGDLDGWRAVVTKFNAMYASESTLPPRKYIWHGDGRAQARDAHDKTQAMLDQVVRRMYGVPAEKPRDARPARRGWLRKFWRRP